MAKESKKDAKVRRQLYRGIIQAVDAEEFDEAAKLYKKYKKLTGRTIRLMEQGAEEKPKKKTRKSAKARKAEARKAHKAEKENGKRGKDKDAALKATLPQRVYQAIFKLRCGAKKLDTEIAAMEDALHQKRADQKVYFDCIDKLVAGFKGKKKTETAEE